MKTTLFSLTAFLCLAWPASSLAQPLDVEDVPGPLRGWVDWVVEQDPHYGCTRIADGWRCDWPGRLTLTLDAAGGTFEQRFSHDRNAQTALPGDGQHWPHGVSLDGRPWPIVTVASLPHVDAGPGDHRVTGSFTWEQVPEVLRVPTVTALVELSIDGEAVDAPRRDDDGTLWLRSRDAAEEGEHLALEVHRRVDDGVPMTVTTHLRVRASGRAREVDLGAILPEGSLATAIRSELPVRLTPAGTLVAQIHAGTFELEIEAVMEGSPERLAPPALEPPWPTQEIWVWAADEALRQVRVGGAPTIDPARTNLPDAWRALPAYALSIGDGALELTTVRRGEPSPPPNQLRLSRELWLDLDGGGYTVRDHLHGQMNQRWRLGLSADELGHVTIGGEAQLITEHEGRPGVEIRKGQVDLRAEWRLEGDVGELPAVAWSEDAQQLDATVRLPPGWSIVAVSGVDGAAGTWVDQWDLFGLFFVLLVSLGLGRLLGWPWGAAGLVLLTLSYHEPTTPLVIWVVLLVVIALCRVLPAGWLQKGATVAWWGVAVIFLGLIIRFTVDQAEGALYPHLAERGDGAFVAPTLGLMDEEMAFEAMEGGAGAAPDAPGPVASSRSQGRRGEPDSLNNDPLGGLLERSSSSEPGWLSSGDYYDPTAVIQTGPGIPDWSWRQWPLTWSGPVDKDHVISLWLLEPWMNRALALLRALLALALLVSVFLARPGKGGPSPQSAKNKRTGPATGAAALLLLLAGLWALPFAPTASAQAEPFPPPAMLQDLRERLTRAPRCSPDCVSTSHMRLAIVGNELVLEAEVNAAAKTAFRIPGPSTNWLPASVTVDGVESHDLALLDEGFLFLRLAPGRHVVRLSGAIPRRDTLTLAFGQPPQRLTLDASEWEVEGVRADGRVAASIQLRRAIAQSDDAEVDEDQLPSWLLVTRTLRIGVRWTLESTARRVNDAGAATVVRIPLLEGESVTESDLQVEDDAVVVSLGRDQHEVRWASVLEPRESLTLVAPEGARLSEQWVLACSPIWSCTTSELAPVAHQQEGRWEPRFRPWPAEQLTVAFDRPAPAEGRSSTIDAATLTLTPGTRLLQAELSTHLRTSSGGPHSWTLPDGAEVQALRIDGQTRALQQEGRELSANLQPGDHEVVIAWQQATGMGVVFRGPSVSVDGEVVNARVQIQMPPDRWLLWTTGPAWGPAVLFWPYLILVLIVAFLLGRTRYTPLGFGQWALLGLGMTQIPIWAALIVVGWFFLLAQREKDPDLGAPWFHARQLGLVFYTLPVALCLYAAVHMGLLIEPDMQVSGGGSSANTLIWFDDRVAALPQPSVVSLPLWSWRIVMLVWALWLAWRFIVWVRWGWQALSTGGLWKPLTPAKSPAPAAAPAAPPAVAPAPAAPVPTPSESAAPATERPGPERDDSGGD